jgi:prevent-host-death family protein
MATYSLSEARAHLAEIVTKVENGDDVTITRHGRPVAYVVTPERWVQQKRLAELEQAHELHGDVEPAVELGLSIKPGYDLEAHIAEIRQAHQSADAGTGDGGIPPESGIPPQAPSER